MLLTQLMPKPFVKWAGGKKQLIKHLLGSVPAKFGCYYEPFVGGGALFFALLPERAVLADSNDELVNAYLVIRDDVESLIRSLRKHENTEAYYYNIREINPYILSPVERASRFIYLNKTCYNGLWRVNSRGKFNVPFGQYKNPKICDEENLRAVSLALQGKEIFCCDFEETIARAKSGDFIYFDPPYHPLSKTASFTKYTKDDFGLEEQKRLAKVFRELDRRGCYLLLSNSNTKFIRELYMGYNIKEVTVNRFINCRGDKRTGITELLISNF